MIVFALNTLIVQDVPILQKVISPYKKFKSPLIEIFNLKLSFLQGPLLSDMQTLGV